MTSIDSVLQDTTRALLRLRGETASVALAEQVVRRYGDLDDEHRLTYFSFLLDELGPDRAAVDAAIERYRDEGDALSLADLGDAAEPARQALFRTLNTAPGGIEALLDMRGRLLQLRRSEPDLEPVERDLSHLLRSWFNRGFLELRQLDWSTPARILEKLIEYEAVHEIQGWDDLRRRLAPDRRSFGFFHPALPDEPIIFVEVALTNGLASSIQQLVGEPEGIRTAAEADTAIFYSITNCQKGLRGISFGNFLIKRVSEILGAELPHLTTFSTLSPVPTFAEWLSVHAPDTDTSDPDALARSCARYLVGARRGALPADPVARFHLRNGARLERICVGGDTSPKGRKESHGVLVNYRYSGQDLAANHEVLVQDGVVVASPDVLSLVPEIERNVGAPSPDTAERT